MLYSDFSPLNHIEFPKYQARQAYMIGFDLANPVLPDDYKDYEQIVRNLTHSACENEGKAFLTVDEKIIQPGMSQRRPGPHVDGQFIATTTSAYWGHGGGGWNHSCNNLPMPRMSVIVASSVAGCKAWQGHFDATPTDQGDLTHAQNLLGEGIILPANQGFLLSPDCVHESMIFDTPTQRQFIRIALPI